MTKKETIRRYEQAARLQAIGFTAGEAETLRRASVTLQRWHNLECGDGNEYGSWAIERDDNGDGPPYMVHHHYRHGKGADYTTRRRIPDRERGAVARIKAAIGQRNGRPCIHNGVFRADLPGGPVSFYVQTDPRGAALYIIRPGDVPEGKDVAAYYSKGICVY